MSKEEIIARVLLDHQMGFRINYDDNFNRVWECSNRDCHVAGTAQHVVEHQAEEIVKALP